jgi:anti-sigma factor RsiW
VSPDQLHPSREDLFAYRDGELKPDRRAVIEAHVVSCHVCRELIDEVSRLEADLKSRAEAPGEGYLERLTERVMGKVRAGDTTPVAERRRSDAEVEWEAKHARAPRLPWVALISTASAAATVIVIGVLLIRQGAVLKHPPQVSVLERSAPDAARARGKTDSLGARPSDAGAAGKRRANREVASKEDAQRRDQAAEPRKEVAKVEADRSQKQSGDAAPTVGEGEAKLKEGGNARGGVVDEGLFGTSKSDQKAQQKDASALPSAPQAAAPQAANEAATAGGARFTALLQRYGLPPTWGPGISDENVLRAEPALRNLYRTGGIESPVDSGRARLYFAEAARVKAGAAPDSATADEIIHHYQRAIRLSAGDPETRRIAAQRLQEFLEERTQAP